MLKKVRVVAEKMGEDQSEQHGKSTMNRKARILIVDDDISIRKTLSTILVREGYLVDTAASGEEAIVKSDSSFYHLALIDFRLPDILGTKLLSLLRVTVPRMRKVIVTGYPVLDNAIDAINRGVDAYLTKPVNFEKLLQVMEQLLEKQSREKEITEQQLLKYLNKRLESERQIEPEQKSPLRLKIGDCELSAELLLYVFVTIGSAPVSFGGVAYGQEGEALRDKLKRLSHEKVLTYEAVDRNGYETGGLCKIEGLKFSEMPTFPVRIMFSAQLAHPFL